MLLSRCEPRLGRHAVYAAFEVEECVDAGHGFERDGRYLVGRLALAHVAGDVGQSEELAPCMAPAERAQYRRMAAVRTAEVVVATIGIGLESAMPPHEMPVWMGLLAIGGKVEECRGRRAAREGRSSRT